MPVFDSRLAMADRGRPTVIGRRLIADCPEHAAGRQPTALQRNQRMLLSRKTRAKYDARARIIKALGHPTRLFIVDELSRGERCVAELTSMIGADVSTVSKHLSSLKHAGLVRDEKRGAQVFYTLRTPCVLNFMSCVESVIESTAKEQLEIAGGSA